MASFDLDRLKILKKNIFFSRASYTTMKALPLYLKPSLILQLYYKIQRIFMSVPKHSEPSSPSGLCIECQTFYGSQANKGLCSSCFKKGKVEKKIEASPVESQKIVELPAVSEKVEEIKKEDLQKDRKRCYACNKKVGLLGTECKCCFVFCNSHRLPEAHSCTIDFRVRGQKELQKTVIKVENSKISKI